MKKMISLFVGFALLLSVLMLLLVGCGSSQVPASSAPVLSALSSATVSIPEVSSTASSTTSAVVFPAANYGQVIDGVFTAKDGSYQVTVPSGIDFNTTSNNAAVFTSTDKTANISITSTQNSAKVTALNENTVEAPYLQLYPNLVKIDFQPVTTLPNVTAYQFDFTTETTKNNKISVYEIISNSKIITLQSTIPDGATDISSQLTDLLNAIVLAS